MKSLMINIPFIISQIWDSTQELQSLRFAEGFHNILTEDTDKILIYIIYR